MEGGRERESGKEEEGGRSGRDGGREKDADATYTTVHTLANITHTTHTLTHTTHTTHVRTHANSNKKKGKPRAEIATQKQKHHTLACQGFRNQGARQIAGHFPQISRTLAAH